MPAPSSIPFSPQVRVALSDHHSMLLVCNTISLLERKHPLQRVMLWGSQMNWVPFHWTWKTYGLNVLMIQGWQTSHSVRFSHCSHWWLGRVYSGDWPVLNWDIFPLYNPFLLTILVSIGVHPSHWLVWLNESIEFVDLPQLQSVTIGYGTFNRVQSVVFASSWMNGLMIQICQNYNRYNLIHLLFKVMVVRIDGGLAKYSSTLTHWQCEVRLNEEMNE